jgi:CHAT domain-containing protein/tetratricopeptide (TPR) repeat protein
MDVSLRALACWMLGVGLATACVVGLCACHPAADGSDEADNGVSTYVVDPQALFAEAEQLRLASDEKSSHRAIPAYGDARAAWIRQGDQALAATASQRLGATYEGLGRLEDALREYLEAASLCRENCDPLLESSISSDIGVVQAMLADSDESLDSAIGQCQRALLIAREAQGQREEAKALTCAAEVEYQRGNLDEALALHLRAKRAWEDTGEPRGYSEALFNLGSVRSDLSQFAEARANLEQARSLWTSSGDGRGEGRALIALGRLEHRQGNYQDALNRFRQALDLLEPTGDSVWQGSGLAGIGTVYLELGDGARALSYWEAALERLQMTGLRTATWDLLLAVGRSHLTLENPSKALDRFEEALTLAEETESDVWKQAYSLHSMSQAYQSLGKPQNSLKCLERALSLQESARDPRLEAAIRSELGNTYEALEGHERAAENFARALELSEDSDDRVGEVTALFGMARAARHRNDLDGAKEYIERSLRIAESLREEVESRELRTSYFASVHRLHELYIEVLMQLHDVHPREGLAAAAFAASERARARSLLESLTEAGIDIRAGVDPELLERELSSRERLNTSVEQRMRSSSARDEKELEAGNKEIQDLQAKHDLVMAEIRSKSPYYAALAQSKPLGLEEVQEELLDGDTVLLEYALGEERSFLWAVAKDELASFELAPRADIEAQAERLYELLTARARVRTESLQQRNRRLEEADAAYWEEAARTSQMLLAPAADRIVGKRLLVVADGALQLVPFGALPVLRAGNDVAPMMVEHEIVNLPSASALAAVRKETLGRKRPEGTVAIFADPVFAPDDPRIDARKDLGPRRSASRLPAIHSGMSHVLRDIGFLKNGELRIPRLEATRNEAAAIVAMVPGGRTLQAIGFGAARSTALSSELGRYRIVHFATHGVSNIETPAMSGILLSMFDDHGKAQDGFLQLQDIYQLHLSADLVVLSACNTALGKRIRGEGIVGIVRAFMHAGAGRVVASLWKVDDEATQALMSRFYREMFESNRSPSAALRSAQLHVWRDTEWQSPFYWAAFVLQGEWQEPRVGGHSR